MKKFNADYIIIGGGPSGLGVASALMERGENFLLLEAESDLGGSLKPLMNPKLTSIGDPSIALSKDIDEIKENVEILSKSENVLLNTTALKIDENEIMALSDELGLLKILFRKAIIATGSRDATSWEMLIVGRNVYGVYTTRAALRLLINEVIFGKKIVVYGVRPLTIFLISVLKGLEKRGKVKLNAIVMEKTRSRNYFDNTNVYVGKVSAIFGDKKINKVTIQSRNGEISVDCDSLVIGAKGKSNDYILRRSGIEYRKGEHKTSRENIVLCGEITKDYDYLDEPFYECMNSIKSLL